MRTMDEQWLEDQKTQRTIRELVPQLHKLIALYPGHRIGLLTSDLVAQLTEEQAHLVRRWN